jgi:hypothetical protein
MWVHDWHDIHSGAEQIIRTLYVRSRSHYLVQLVWSIRESDWLLVSRNHGAEPPPHYEAVGSHRCYSVLGHMF